MNKRHFKTRFYVIASLLIVAATVLLVLLLVDRNSGELQNSTVNMTLSAPCVIIRDESSVYADKYNRITYLVNEGERVEEGTAVAQVYKWGYSEDMTQSLLKVQRDIYKEQMLQTAGISNPELDNLDLQIEQKQAAIRNCVMNGSKEDLQVLARELKALLVQRTESLKASVQPTETLNTLYASEQEKLTQLSDYWTEVTSTDTGVVSFYFDGYEQVLSADKLDMLNAEVISSVVKAGPSIFASFENQLYRLVDDAHWYVAFVTQSTDPVRLVAGEVYTVAFEGYADAPVAGTALAPVVSESGVLNIIEFYTDMGDFLSLRTIKGEITCSATGLSVPISALTVKDGAAGITLQEGGDEAIRVEVEVLASNGEYAVVRAADGHTLYAGQRYVEK